MSTTEIDFWSQIDSAPTADEPQQSSSKVSQAGDEADRSASERSEASDSESPIPASSPELHVTRPAEAGGTKSKSQRIREFMAAHPEVRNKDIVEALREYGVTAADVSNVRTQIRMKAEKQQRAKARVESSAGQETSSGSRTSSSSGAARATAPGATRGRVSAAKPASTSAAGEIAMAEIEAGLSFIEQAGSIERARQVVDLIARIRDISLTH